MGKGNSRSKLPRIALVFGAAVLVAAGVWRVLTLSAETEVRRLARDNGIALGAAELFPPYAGDSAQNGASHLADLSSGISWLRKKRSRLLGVEPPRSTDELRTAVAEAAAMYAVIEKMTECPDWFVAHEGRMTAMLLPEFVQLENAAKAVSLRLKLKAAQGDAEGAISDLRRIFRLAQFSGSQPLLVGEEMQLKISQLGLATAARLLPAAASDTAVTDRLHEALGAEPRLDHTRATRGEAAMAVEIALNGLRHQDIGGLGPEEPVPPGLRMVEAGIEMSRFYWGPRLTRAWVNHGRALRGAPFDSATAEKSYKTHLEPLASSRNPLDMAAGVITPVLGQRTLVLRRLATQRSLLEAGLKAFLGGSGAAQYPIDPFSNRPLLGAKTDVGWKIYSVGSDGNDDGGRANRAGGKGDIVLEWDGTTMTMLGA